MRFISCKLEDLRKMVLPIGYEGENDHTRVQVDAGEVFKEYPAAVPYLKVHGPGGTIYPAEVTRDGKNVIWDIKASDCAADGSGEAQFTFTLNNVIVKSCIAKIKVYRSIVGGSTPPDPVQDWIDDAEEVLDDLAAMDNIAKTAEAGDVGKALSPKTVVDGVVTEWQYVEPGAGTEDYTDLENKPQIGGVTLSGDKSLHDLGIAAESAIPDVSGKANLSVVAPAFVQETANDAGSLVTYTDGVVYVLPEGHTAGTTWANTQKTATNIAEQQRLLLSGIHGLEESKAPVIIVESETKNTFSATELAEYGNNYVLVCDPDDYNKVIKANAENIIPDTDAYSGTIVSKGVGNLLNISGSVSSTITFYTKVNNSNMIPFTKNILQGDKVSVAYHFDGEITGNGSGSPIKCEFYFNNSDSTYNEHDDFIEKDSGIVQNTYTADKNTSGFHITFVIRKNYTFNGVLSWSVTDGQNTYSFVTIPTTGNIEISKQDIGNNGFTIFPPKAFVRYAADTKEYVDNHIPADVVTETQLEEYNPTLANMKYITPEMFGAKGDGNTNDATAIQNCINYAITNGVAVRGFGDYKVGPGIDIIGSNLDIYLRRITLSAGSYAVKMTGRYNHFKTDYISTYDITGATAFILATTQDGNDCSSNVIDLGVVYAYANGIQINNEYASTKQVYYNRFYTQIVVSQTGNCVHIQVGGQCSENSFWMKYVRSNNYAVYASGCEESVKFYEMSMENACKKGVYGSVTLINCRTQECMDRKRPDNREGIIFEFHGMPTGKAINTKLDYVAVDVSNGRTLQQTYDMIKTLYESGKSKAEAYDFSIPARMNDVVVGQCLRLWDYYAVSQFGDVKCPPGKIIAYFNHKGFVPDVPWKHSITVASYTPFITDGYVPTIFDIDENTTIYLEDSYCCVGINEIQIVQKNGKKATVYDKENNLIFDGTNETDGTYKLVCNMTPFTFDVVTNNGTLTYGPQTNEGKYFITNEEWTAEKLNVI